MSRQYILVLVLQTGILKKKQPPIAKNQRQYISYSQYEEKGHKYD